MIFLSLFFGLSPSFPLLGPIAPSADLQNFGIWLLFVPTTKKETANRQSILKFLP